MILAVDPGLTGAFAWTDGTAYAVRDMPTISRLAGARNKPRAFIDENGVEHLLRTARLNATILVLEKVGGRPAQAAHAAFVFGYGYGLIRGIGQALDYQIEEVSSATWKSALKVSSDKQKARARACELLPAYASLWPLKKHDGLAEAAMLALYGWQVFGPQGG